MEASEVVGYNAIILKKRKISNLSKGALSEEIFSHPGRRKNLSHLPGIILNLFCMKKRELPWTRRTCPQYSKHRTVHLLH
jgi:hypothetical protein